MDTISRSETSLLGKLYMHQENNSSFMTKTVNFAFFPWTLLGHSKKNTDLYNSDRIHYQILQLMICTNKCLTRINSPVT